MRNNLQEAGNAITVLVQPGTLLASSADVILHEAILLKVIDHEICGVGSQKRRLVMASRYCIDINRWVSIRSSEVPQPWRVKRSSSKVVLGSLELELALRSNAKRCSHF
jgi:hypothetical protein